MAITITGGPPIGVLRAQAADYTPWTPVVVADSAPPTAITFGVYDDLGNAVPAPLISGGVPTLAQALSWTTSGHDTVVLDLPTGGPLTMQVRTPLGAVLATSAPFTVGDLRLIIGQSNESRFATEADAGPAEPLDPRTLVYGAGAWAAPTAGTGLASMLAALTARTGVPQFAAPLAVVCVGFTLDGYLVQKAAGTFVDWWANLTGPTMTAARAVLSSLQAAGQQPVAGMILGGAEQDGVRVAGHALYGALDIVTKTLIGANGSRTPPAFRIAMVEIGDLSQLTYPGGAGLPPGGFNRDIIARAQRRFAADTPGAYIAASKLGYPRDDSSLPHLTAWGFRRLARDLASAIAREEYGLT